MIGCCCDVCRSTDPRDRRSRHAALVQEGERTLLVDAPPELRLQLVDAEVDSVDALFLTHLHADHVHGLDDASRAGKDRRKALPTYVGEDMTEGLGQRFAYLLHGRLSVLCYREGEPFSPLGGEVLTPFRVAHTEDPTYGFRIGELGYVTDAKRIPRLGMELLEGVETLVLNALWWTRAHSRHFNIEEAVGVARELSAKQVYLTHLSHRVKHSRLLRDPRLPDFVRPAFDGLTVEIGG